MKVEVDATDRDPRQDGIPRALPEPRPLRPGDLWCGACKRVVPSPVAGVAGPYQFRVALHALLDGCNG